MASDLCENVWTVKFNCVELFGLACIKLKCITLAMIILPKIGFGELTRIKISNSLFAKTIGRVCATSPDEHRLLPWRVQRRNSSRFSH